MRVLVIRPYDRCSAARPRYLICYDALRWLSPQEEEAMADKRVSITWLGHGTFLYQTPADKRVLVDPWIDGNPKFPSGWRARLEELDGILLTHGHFDHVDSLAALAISTGAPIFGIFDMAAWLVK